MGLKLSRLRQAGGSLAHDEGTNIAAIHRTATSRRGASPVKALTPPRLTVVTLGVSDLARSRRFYCEGHGFAPSSASNDHIIFLDAGGSRGWAELLPR
jgi:hypothetical protein